MKCRRPLASCSRARWALGALAAGLASLAVASASHAKVFHTQKEALALAFPDADRIDSDTSVLTAEQAEAVEKASRAKLESRIAKFYIGRKGEEVLGYAYIDVHTVRTLPEAFLVVLDPEGRVRSLRVLAFHEPLDYLPTKRWYEQFERKTLDEELRLDRDIHGIVGATLSARAVTASVRRVLALYQVLIAGSGEV